MSETTTTTPPRDPARRLREHREQLHAARRALHAREADTVEAQRQQVAALEGQTAELERDATRQRRADALQALRPDWEADRAEKRALWTELYQALDVVNDVWQRLEEAHARQRTQCHDLPDLPRATAQDWIVRTKLRVFFPTADPPHPTLTPPHEQDHGVSGTLRDVQPAAGKPGGYIGVLVPRRERR